LSEHQQPNEKCNPQWLDEVLLETVQGIELDDSPTVEEQLALDLYKESSQLIRPYDEIDSIRLSIFGFYTLDSEGVSQLDPDYHELLLVPIGDTDKGTLFECPEIYSEYSEPTRVLLAGSLYTARHEPFTVGGASMLSPDGWPVAERGTMVESVIEDCPGVIVHKQIGTMGRLAFYFTYCQEEIEATMKEEPDFNPKELTPVGSKKGSKEFDFCIPDYISVHPGVVVGISTKMNSGSVYEQGIILKQQATS
jgi:hypothetical protein